MEKKKISKEARSNITIDRFHTERTESTIHATAKTAAKEPVEQLFGRDLLVEHRAASTSGTRTEPGERRGTRTRRPSAWREPAVGIPTKLIVP
jgi:hypothetical protein